MSSSSQITQHFKVTKEDRDSSKKGTQGRVAAPLESVTSTSGKQESEKELEMLKQFDLNWEFGPCMGMTRLERWNRAEKYGLNPPTDVRDLLVQHSQDEQYTHSLWDDYKILN